MSFQVFVEGANAAFVCREHQSVLGAMTQAGQRCLQVGCRSGGCGVCRVQVTSGDFDTGLMSAAQVSGSDRRSGMALACQLFPRSDLHLRALGPLFATVNPATARLLSALGKAA